MTKHEDRNPEALVPVTPPNKVNRILYGGGPARREPSLESILVDMTTALELDPNKLQVMAWQMTASPDVPNIEGLDGVLAKYHIKGYRVPQVSVSPPVPTNPCDCSYYVTWDWTSGLHAGKSCSCT